MTRTFLYFLKDVCQTSEQLKPRLMTLCSVVKRLGEGSQLEEEMSNLQKQRVQLLEKAAEKQALLESLLSLWQRYEDVKITNTLILLHRIGKIQFPPLTINTPYWLSLSLSLSYNLFSLVSVLCRGQFWGFFCPFLIVVLSPRMSFSFNSLFIQ